MQMNCADGARCVKFMEVFEEFVSSDVKVFASMIQQHESKRTGCAVSRTLMISFTGTQLSLSSLARKEC